jgi:hypothetical protein
MDPNANLMEQERLIIERREANRTQDSGERPYNTRRRSRLRDLRYALAEWLYRKGFEPDWSKAPNARKYYGR